MIMIMTPTMAIVMATTSTIQHNQGLKYFALLLSFKDTHTDSSNINQNNTGGYNYRINVETPFGTGVAQSIQDPQGASFIAIIEIS